MLLLYQMRALAHSSLSRITDETWAMDGFVSIHGKCEAAGRPSFRNNPRAVTVFFPYYLFIIQCDR